MQTILPTEAFIHFQNKIENGVNEDRICIRKKLFIWINSKIYTRLSEQIE